MQIRAAFKLGLIPTFIIPSPKVTFSKAAFGATQFSLNDARSVIQVIFYLQRGSKGARQTA